MDRQQHLEYFLHCFKDKLLAHRRWIAMRTHSRHYRRMQFTTAIAEAR